MWLSLYYGELFHFDLLNSWVRVKVFLLSMLEPTFVSMAQMPESEKSEEGDDDKVYLFFSETAVEFDCYNTLVVSRVARVCKVIEFTMHACICHSSISQHNNKK